MYSGCGSRLLQREIKVKLQFCVFVVSPQGGLWACFKKTRSVALWSKNCNAKDRLCKSDIREILLTVHAGVDYLKEVKSPFNRSLNPPWDVSINFMQLYS